MIIPGCAHLRKPSSHAPRCRISPCPHDFPCASPPTTPNRREATPPTACHADRSNSAEFLGSKNPTHVIPKRSEGSAVYDVNAHSRAKTTAPEELFRQGTASAVPKSLSRRGSSRGAEPLTSLTPPFGRPMNYSQP